MVFLPTTLTKINHTFFIFFLYVPAISALITGITKTIFSFMTGTKTNPANVFLFFSNNTSKYQYLYYHNLLILINLNLKKYIYFHYYNLKYYLTFTIMKLHLSYIMMYY